MANQGGRYEIQDGKKVLIERTHDRRLGEKDAKPAQQKPADKPAKKGEDK